MASQKKKYRAKVGLNYPTDPKIIKRLKAGENIPLEQRKTKRLEAGEIANDIPASSVPWLLSQGCIEEVEEGG